MAPPTVLHFSLDVGRLMRFCSLLQATVIKFTDVGVCFQNQREVFTRVRVAQALSSTSDDEFRQ